MQNPPEEDSSEQPMPPVQPADPRAQPPQRPAVANPDQKVEHMENMPFDEAINVDESGSVKSEDEDAAGAQPSGVQVKAQQKPTVSAAGKRTPLNAIFVLATALSGIAKATGGAQTEQKEEDSGEDDNDGRPTALGDNKIGGQSIPANAYNPMDYAHLKVSTEISELFQYISRYHPHNVELDTKFRPFIPEYIPAVGEVDAFLKVPRPDGVEELLGLSCLVF